MTADAGLRFTVTEGQELRKDKLTHMLRQPNFWEAGKHRHRGVFPRMGGWYSVGTYLGTYLNIIGMRGASEIIYTAFLHPTNIPTPATITERRNQIFANDNLLSRSNDRLLLHFKILPSRRDPHAFSDTSVL